MLIFGVTSDKWSRTGSLMVSTVILAVFAALAAGSYGGGSLHGMITALTIYRFFVGVGIGGEYPAGSVACSEATGELKEGTRNRWFISKSKPLFHTEYLLTSSSVHKCCHRLGFRYWHFCSLSHGGHLRY